jgi:hypothetical protein
MAKSKVTSDPKENQESTVELGESIFELRYQNYQI